MPEGACTSARVALASDRVRRAVSESPPNYQDAEEALRDFGQVAGATSRMQDVWCENVSGRFRKAVDKKTASEAAAYVSMPIASDGCKERWARLAPRIEARAKRALKRADYPEAESWASLLSRAPGYFSQGASLKTEASEREARAEQRAAEREEARLRARYKKVVDTWQGRIKRVLASCKSYQEQAWAKKQRVDQLVDAFDPRAEREEEALRRWLERTENGSLFELQQRLQTIFEEMEEAESYGHDTRLRRNRLEEESWRCEAVSFY